MNAQDRKRKPRKHNEDSPKNVVIKQVTVESVTEQNRTTNEQQPTQKEPTEWKELSFERRTEFKINGAIAGLTFLVVIFTGAQVWLTRDHSKKELRAYVDIQNVRISRPEAGKPIKIYWEVKNFGQTPTLNLSLPLNGGLLDRILPNHINSMHRLIEVGAVDYGFPLNPGAVIADSSENHILFRDIVVPDSLGERTVYFAGIAFWHDVFEKPRDQEFVFRYDFELERTVRVSKSEYSRFDPQIFHLSKNVTIANAENQKTEQRDSSEIEYP